MAVPGGGRVTKITAGLSGKTVMGFEWSDDSTRLAYTTGNRDSARLRTRTKLYVSSRRGGESTLISDSRLTTIGERIEY